MLSGSVFFHLSVNGSRANPSGWGDTQYAEGLGRAIKRITGCDWALLFRGEQPQLDSRRHVVIRIFGPHLEEPVAGLTNVLWMISPPTLAPLSMLARYQAVFVASRPLTERLTSDGLPARYLPQVTEALHFRPDLRKPGETTLPLVFVGGYAQRAGRPIIFNAIAEGFEPMIWGPGWEGVVPEHLWQGKRLDYQSLAEVYARARIIFNSHMPQMAQYGFMSNRSYDAMASGALVVSDNVTGFTAPDLPELMMVGDRAGLRATLDKLLSAPERSTWDRQELHERLAAGHTFDTAAATILEAVEDCFARNEITRPAWQAGRSTGLPPPQLSHPAASAPLPMSALKAAADEILALARYLEQKETAPLPAPPPTGEESEGVIHALMADLRQAQEIAVSGASEANAAELDTIVAAARRVAEALPSPRQPFYFRTTPMNTEYLVSRIRNNAPLWSHSPAGFDRESGKRSLQLWSKKSQPDPERDIGVFLHLYYDDLAPVFAERLQAISHPYKLYVSTDSEAKAERIRTSLPDAEIRVLPNRGRDIMPKLYGFRDVYDRHDIALHLHGKKSSHSGKLEEWLAHILDCLLGSPEEVNRILSLFAALPRLGMITPVTHRNVLGAAHWGDNFDVARELHHRMGLKTALPDNGSLRFPVGSMFWLRVAAIRPLLDLDLKPAHFPPEAGQIDGTLAHAIERMLGVVCLSGGWQIVPVSGAGSRLHAKHQLRFTSNGDLRRALESGASPF